MVMQNLDDKFKSSSGFNSGSNTGMGGYDPQSLAEKMSKFKFAKAGGNIQKDQDWFSKLNNKADDNEETSKANQKRMKSGLTEEEERQIHREMIP